MVGLLASVVFLISGCATLQKPVVWNISIDKTTPASIEVDLIGITASEIPAWESMNVDKYLAPGSQLRKDADKNTVDLKMGKQLVLSKTDPKWSGWLLPGGRGVDHLVIIANLPGQWQAGTGDWRRKIIPLDKRAWQAKNDTLEFQVKDTEISEMTARTPRGKQE